MGPWGAFEEQDRAQRERMGQYRAQEEQYRAFQEFQQAKREWEQKQQREWGAFRQGCKNFN